MANDQLPEKMEDAVAGAKELVVRLCRTLLVLVARPRLLLLAVRDGPDRERLLHPHAFLLCCAVLLGFLGKILADGIDNLGFDVLSRVQDLTLTSFLNHSVPVFAIAVAAAIAVELAFPGQDAQKRRHFKDLDYYVIGFFGIGSLLVLLLLAGLLRLTFDEFGPRTDFFVLASSIAIAGYVIAVYVLLYWLTSNALRGASAAALSWTVAARTLLVNGVVVALCVLNFVSPLYQYEEGARPLRGSVTDLAWQPGGVLRLTYLVENASDADVALSRLDDPVIVAELAGDVRLELTAYFGSGCGPEDAGAGSGFLLLAPGESRILASCTGDARIGPLLDKAGFVTIDRGEGERRLVALDAGGRELALSIRLRASVAGRREGWFALEL